MVDNLPTSARPEALQLTEMQDRFVTAIVTSGASATECARQAGYAAPGVEAYRLMRLPHILAAVRERRIVAVEGDLTGLALKTLYDTMQDAGATRDVRLKAAKIVLELGQFAKKDSGNRDLGKKSMADMTIDELRAMAAQLRQDARNDARDVDAPAEDTSVINAIAEPVTP
jgi:phage terminase small subunit